MNTHSHYSKFAFAAFVAFAFLAMGAVAAEWPDRTTLPIPLRPFEGKTGKTYKTPMLPGRILSPRRRAHPMSSSSCSTT